MRKNFSFKGKKTWVVTVLLSCFVFYLGLTLITTTSAISTGQIIVGASAPEMEKYAARELQRYLYEISGTLLPVNTDSAAIDRASFVVGQKTTNSKINDLVNGGYFTVGLSDPGAQGYLLKKISYNSQEVIAIAGSDAVGSLYGVYGLLDDYYGIGFYMGGDVLPDTRSTLNLVSVDEKKAPRQYIRGFLPWTNFPQSATVYSMEDYKSIIDQMSKMRMNFIHIHNYNGEAGHNEMFHNFTYNNITSRVWMATAKSGHGWAGPSWDVSEYRFKAGDLFDDGDFGADCALHNKMLLNMDVFRKGSSEFQRVLQYAHSRGVKIGLGLDINLIPGDYGTTADNPAVVDARTDQVINDYPDLDYLLCFRSEGMGQGQSTIWNNIFNQMYNRIKANAPQIKIAVSGWGIDGATSTGWPADVICAPISAYSAGCVNGSEYGTREYWGCPWMERDFNSSVYYYPYNMNISDTITAYQNRSSNMKGFLTLTWRLTDAVDPKIAYIAKVPWETLGRYTTSQSVYNDYAVKNYGSASASDITAIINQNEPYAVNASECEGTPSFTGSNRSTDINKAVSQLATIDGWINSTSAAGAKARLKLLRCRIEAEKAYCELDQNFPSITWSAMPGSFETWARDFRDRVTDISSLGNVQSSENRLVNLRYVAMENSLRSSQTVKSPSHVVARGTTSGAVVTWYNEETSIQGFNVYRGTTKLNSALLASTTTSYTDSVNGTYSYTVTAVNTGSQESVKSVPSTCKAGTADTDAPNVVVVSAPSSGAIGQPADVEARVLDDRTFGSISATLYYRTLGTVGWTSVTMDRRNKAIFTARIPASAITTAGLEYYVSASDGTNTGYFPKTAPAIPMSLVGETITDITAPGVPGNPTANGSIFQWGASTGDVHWYKIYRSVVNGFTLGKATFLTFVYKDTTSFQDKDLDFDGNRLNGVYYYRITAVDKSGNESAPTAQLSLDLNNLISNPYNKCFASEYTTQSGIQVAPCSEGGDCVGYIENGDWIEFDNLNFGTGATSFEARVASPASGGNIELRLDSLTGTLIGTCAVTVTGDWQIWTTKTCGVSGASGTHKLYLKFTGGTGYLLNITWFKFYGNGTPAPTATPTPTPTPATGAPIGYWRLDETSGTSAADSSGNNRTGTTSGGTTWVAGKVNNGLSFNGTNAYLSIPDGFDPTAFSVALWVKPAVTSAQSILVRTDASGSTASWSHQLSINSSGKFEAYMWDGAAKTVTGTTTVSANTWYHIALTAANNGQMKLYVNGQAEGTAASISSMWTGGDRYWIGSNSGGGKGWFNGSADDAKLYDYALTSTDISNLYNSYGATPTPTPTPTPAPTATPTPTPVPGTDDFNSSTLNAQWSWVREDNTHWSLTAAPGSMRIISQFGDIWTIQASQKNILLQNASGDWTIITKAVFSAKPSQNYEQGGLIVYQDDNNYVKIVRCFSVNAKFVFGKEVGGTYTEESATDGISGGTVYLKITKSGSNYTAYYSSDGTNYTQVGTTQAISFGTIKRGLVSCNGEITAAEINVDFDYFTVN
jgi:hypothetical protein